MQPNKKDCNCLQTILHCVEKIERYKNEHGNTYADFKDNIDYQDLCYYALVQIGEAVHLLSDEFRSFSAEIDWESIYGMRCYLVHGYDSVNSNIIWDVINNDILELKKICKMYI